MRQFGAGIFNFKLIGAIAGTIGVVLHPLVARADTDNSTHSDRKQKSSKASIGTSQYNSQLAIRNSQLMPTDESRGLNHKGIIGQSSRKYNRSKQLIEALSVIKNNKNQDRNVIALNKKDTNTNLPASLQKLVDERDYAGKYILTALKTEDTNTNLPASLQKLVDERNNTAENTLIALKPAEVNTISLIQKLKETRSEVIAQPELIALEPFINQEKLLEENNNVESSYIAPVASVVEPKSINIEEAEYTASLQNTLLPIDTSEQFSNNREQINSTGNYLLALEPFLDAQKLAEAEIEDPSSEKTIDSTLVAINVFESISSNTQPPSYIPIIAKNWTTDNLTNKTYSFTSLVAIKPSFLTDNSDRNSSQMKLAATYNSFTGDNRNQDPNNNFLAAYSKSPFALPNPELNPNLAPNSTQYISQFPKDANNSATVTILAPTPDALVDVAATPIIVQFPVGNEVELRVNGDLSDRSLIGRTETDSTTDLVTQTWYGVSLQNGENIISAQVIGSKEPPATVKIMVRGGAHELKIDTVESRIPADGISTATIKGTLIDENGNRSNHDAVVTLATTAGEFVEPDFKPGQPGFQVQAKSGQFTATLKSDLEAKTVRIKAKAGKLEAFTQLQFQTALRPSLMTGVIDFRVGARGTDFYSRFKDFLPEDEDNDTEVKFRSAVFATGAIGEWLVTGA
ncbi:MAG: hypothetical protein WBA41_21990, partial [Rivularia sp. (in: cyanobacteria)]